MHFHVCNGLGDSIDAPSVEQMRAFLDDLDPNDEEHGAAWLTNDDEVSLEYEVGGNLCFSRGDAHCHLPKVTKEKVLELWIALSRGELAVLEREDWQPGFRAPMSPEDREARERVFAASQLASDREFYDTLGLERPATPCRHPGCDRGSVSLSVFCRPHHFASIRGRTCPFND